MAIPLFLSTEPESAIPFAKFRGSCGLGDFAKIDILMANKPKGYGTWDAALGLVLTGLAVLLFLALVSYQPSDLPPWAKLIYDSNVRSPIVHNLCGIVGAVAAGYLYFFFGAASYLWIIVFAGYGIAKLTTRNFRIRERLGWSFLFALSGACLLAIARLGSLRIGKALPYRGSRRLAWQVDWREGFRCLWWRSRRAGGARCHLSHQSCAGDRVSSVNVLKRGWSAFKAYFVDREKRRLAAMEEDRADGIRKTQIVRQAEKLERKLKKKGDSSPPRSPESPEPEIPEPRIIDATFPLEKRPSLAEIEGGRKKREEPKPSLGGLRLENYKLPLIDLLDPLDEAGRRPADHDELRAVQAIIIETLAHFGIGAKAGDITRGPTITRFEVYPDSGVRVDRITSLERDIARATRAQRINILAPIPGKDTVGIEIANPTKVKVALREVLETADWERSAAKLPLALGKDVYGQTIIADLAQMPHCLVAGTTGSGKSVCINSMIASLLFRSRPRNCALS